MQKINGAFDSQRLALNLGVYSFWVCSGCQRCGRTVGTGSCGARLGR